LITDRISYNGSITGSVKRSTALVDLVGRIKVFEVKHINSYLLYLWYDATGVFCTTSVIKHIVNQKNPVCMYLLFYLFKIEIVRKSTLSLFNQ